MLVVAAAILHNTTTNRYHPILYRMAPTPGGAGETATTYRVKSLGHHTVGFDTLEQAEADIDNNEHLKNLQVRVRGIYANWDGKDLPANVAWIKDGQLV